MKRIARAIIPIILVVLLTATAQSNPYDESKACIGPGADMVDYYLGVYRPLEYVQDLHPVSN